MVVLISVAVKALERNRYCSAFQGFFHFIPFYSSTLPQLL
jgi:hypothetical protein